MEEVESLLPPAPSFPFFFFLVKEESKCPHIENLKYDGKPIVSHEVNFFDLVNIDFLVTFMPAKKLIFRNLDASQW